MSDKSGFRGHKNLKDDFEAAAKYFGIDYEVEIDGEEVVMILAAEDKDRFYRAFFSGKWRNKDRT